MFENKCCFVLTIYSEKIKSKFKGTIIDLETVGDFCNIYCDEDSRRYKDLILTIFGYITQNELNILCAEGIEFLEELKTKSAQIVPTLQRPLFAFNCSFERGVLFHSCGAGVEFDGELNIKMFEKKKHVVSLLRIPNYDDPFFDDGFGCVKA